MITEILSSDLNPIVEIVTKNILAEMGNIYKNM
ncbi:hypothetical protein QF028_002106 [Neobacillus sp. B4I6]|jgi:hypothetical protein